ncbi:MAG: hypothetical protein AB1898_13165 [Acidobacteriota bacterium]
MRQPTLLAGIVLALLIWIPGTGLHAEQAEEPEPSTRETEQVEPPSTSRVWTGGISLFGRATRYRDSYAWPGDAGSYPYFGGLWSPWWPPSDPSESRYPSLLFGLHQQLNKGEVQLRQTEDRDEVFLNGAYAGLAKELKSFWLDPGIYELQIRSGGQSLFSERVYVLSGKTLRINARRQENQP